MIGIGVNCAHHPDGTEYPATDLAAAGVRATPDSLFAPLSAAMVARLAQWDRGAGFAAIRADWLARAAGIGKPIRVKTGDGELAGTFEAIDDAGRLVLRLADGTMQADGGGRRVSTGVTVEVARMAGPQGELVFAPLGGVGEIGMNLSIYGLGDARKRTWLVVDVGVSFAQEENLPGIDLVLPDIRYLIEERRNLAGIVLTHAHEDHFGALIDLWPKLKVPIYATPFTAALFEAKRAGRAGRAGDPGQGGGARLALQRRAVRHRTCARSRIRSRNPTR